MNRTFRGRRRVWRRHHLNRACNGLGLDADGFDRRGALERLRLIADLRSLVVIGVVQVRRFAAVVGQAGFRDRGSRDSANRSAFRRKALRPASTATSAATTAALARDALLGDRRGRDVCSAWLSRYLSDWRWRWAGFMTGRWPCLMQRAFDASRAALSELHLCRQGFDAHRQLLRFEAAPRDLEHEALHDFVVERVPLSLTALAFSLALCRRLIQLRLRVECRDQRIRIEKQLEDRIQQSSKEPERSAM